MAKKTGAELITLLCDVMGWTNNAGAATAAQRAAALQHLQDAENWFAQQGSFKHLERETTLTLGNGVDFVAIPDWVDIGKTMSLGLPNGNGELKIVPSDRFRRDTKYTYGAWGLTSPSQAKISLDSNGTARRFIFDRTNTTGGNLVYPFSAQQLPNTLTDGATTSSLPEGYETTLLMKRAELYHAKPAVRAVVTDQERDDFTRTMVNPFFDQYRTSKEVSMPDSEAKARKVSEVLQEGR